MSAPHDSLQLDVEDISTESRLWRENTRLNGLELSTLSNCSHQEETTPLSGAVTPRGHFVEVKSRFMSRNCCLKSSKAALLILVWNLIISFGILGLLDPTALIYLAHYNINIESLISGLLILYYGFGALLFLFYPLAGFLADVQWGRLKITVNSLCTILWSLVLAMVLAGVAVVGFIPVIIQPQDTYPNTIQTIVLTVICLVIGIPVLIALLLALCGLISFSANVVQFGIDQLRDAPIDDSVLFIHWYVWTTFAGLLIIRLMTGVLIGILNGTHLLPIALILLGITLWLQRHKQNWFIVDSGSNNPYKLVFKVLKFAKDHTQPIRRSAFTYCEDELPSRLDLGKEKYGGPFTTEQVENVKALTGILCVLLTSAPLFTSDFAVNEMLTILAMPEDYYNNTFIVIKRLPRIFTSGCLTPLIIVVVIPSYLFLLRPFIHDYIPGMLKRIGLGMVLFFVSALSTLLMGVIKYDCIPGSCNSVNDYLEISPNYLVVPNILNAFGAMFFYVALFEFICAQSPHSMKGLLIGVYFAIKGVFQLLGLVAIYIPTVFLCKSGQYFPICGFIYYLINTVILLIGIIAFTIVAKRYEYRERDEPDNIYHYAEQYYANAQDEPNYDYDDYDNLT